MKDSQRISDYLVRFSGLATRCPWGDPALRYRFYEGLPPRIKDELTKGEGKPRTLRDMKQKAQNIDARYWERQQERSREQGYQRGQSTSKTPTSSSTNTPASTSGSKPSVPTHQASKPKNFKPSAAPRVDLTGKLDSQGKLTQQERQRRIDKNLCMFCGGTGHRTDTCPVKAASAKARTATASASTSTPPQPKASGTEKKKD